MSSLKHRTRCLYRASRRMASVPFQSSKWMHTPGKTSLAAATKASVISSSSSSVGGVVREPR